MRIDLRKATETELRTTKRGYRLSTTVGGSLTGRGGSIIIIDDPMKAADAHSQAARHRVNSWFEETLLSRLDNKKDDAIILVMQRLYVDDKIVRMSACTAKIEAGSVFMTRQAPWLDDLLAFSSVRYDDQADALSQLTNWTRTKSIYTLDFI